ncbi:biotin/lipoyl-containing protein, partial [Rathayibacter tanaceti]
MTEQFLLPDVGEGLTEAEIVAWRVKVGDEVAVNQVLVEIETAKSLVELPSPFSGTVVDVLVEEGQTVDVGTAIITVQAGAGTVGSEVPAIPAHPAQAATPPAPSTTEPGE